MITPKAFDWIAPATTEPLVLDWQSKGDEWLDFVLRRIGAVTGSTGSQMQSYQEPPYGVVVAVTDSSLRSSLWMLLPTTGGPLCFIIGEGEQASDQISPWVEAIHGALGMIGTSIPFKWWAIIGQDPDSRYGGTAAVLSEPAVIGELHLVPGTNIFRETRVRRSSLYQSMPVASGLVRVNSVAHGYSWNVAQQSAARDLKALCAALSVFWGFAWVPRQLPSVSMRLVDGDAVEVDVGEVYESPRRSWWDREDRPDDDWNPQVNHVMVPVWASTAWGRIQSNKKLATVILAFHEALLMEAEHPSYASLAYVSVVEAIGNRAIKKLPRCECCKLVTGATERFRATLARVLPEAESTYLGKLYGKRSLTAHEGVLHGSDLLGGGVTSPNILTADPIWGFERTMWALRAAARRLILVELGRVVEPTSVM